MACLALPGESLELVRAWRLEGGTSATLTAVEVVANGGSPNPPQTVVVVIRQAGAANTAADPETICHEALVLKTLHRAGLPVPRVLHVDESADLLPTPYLVMEFVDATPCYNPSDGTGVGRALGRFLAQLHAVDVSETSSLSSLPRHDKSGPQFLAVDRDLLPEKFRDAHAMLEAAWPPPSRQRQVLAATEHPRQHRRAHLFTNLVLPTPLDSCCLVGSCSRRSVGGQRAVSPPSRRSHRHQRAGGC